MPNFPKAKWAFLLLELLLVNLICTQGSTDLNVVKLYHKITDKHIMSPFRSSKLNIMHCITRFGDSNSPFVGVHMQSLRTKPVKAACRLHVIKQDFPSPFTNYRPSKLPALNS
uniref:Secreted protein n=1 Tax=Pyxicephalus adspersus TaxID=30357 RepID=A0AAV3B4Z6_PYXAD|nr:TPA: hypothetical protein GDO54_006360 [Pyxicephalus adspersus]